MVIGSTPCVSSSTAISIGLDEGLEGVISMGAPMEI